MMDKAKFIKRLLFGGILTMISLPMIMTFYPLIQIDPLKGSFEDNKRPQFGWNPWFSGKYQDSMALFINDKTGGRPFLVRVNNQLDYSIFGKANVSSVVIGKNDYLYEQSYINAYYGTDFVGWEKVDEKIRKLQAVSDTLKSKGITLVVAFAPGKGSFFPEFIPDNKRRRKGTTNYEVYRKRLAMSSIAFIDLKSWFGSMKNTSLHPLFPKTGIHWSSYGEVIAADSLISFINGRTDKTQIPDLEIVDVETSNYAYNTDDDIEKSMNLLFNIPDDELGYPKFRPVHVSDKPITRVLTIADSYYWGMYHWGLTKDYFGDGSFWYYNKEVYPDSFKKMTHVEDMYSMYQEVKKHNVVLLLFTDANLKEFAYGFVERLYDEFNNDGIRKREARIAKIIEDIYNTPEWLTSIKKQAKKDGITLEEALRRNAIYSMQTEGK